METAKKPTRRIKRALGKCKQPDEELYESEERYRLLTELSPDAVIIHCEDKIVFANATAARLTGVQTPQELIGKSALSFVHPSYRNIIIKRLNDMQIEGKFAPMMKEKLTRPNGVTIDAEVTGALIHYKGKQAFITIVRDISDREKAEEELKLKAMLLDAVIDPIILHDLEGNFIYMNEASYKPWGYSKEEMIKKMTLYSLDTPEYAKLIEPRIKELLEKGDMIFEAAHFSKDMSVCPVEVRARTVDAGGKKLILSVTRDISERKKNQELKANNEKNIKLLSEALEYNQLKTEFFSNLSHELRTPLNIILGTTQLLDLYFKSDSITDNKENIDRYLKSMKQNSYRLLRLINNLIDITKIDAGFLKPNMQNCDIISVVEDITLSVVDYAKSKNITLLFDTDTEEKMIACDPDKIDRIVLNLLSNAIKFTKSGGSITVNIYDRGDYVAICVKDTGIGMPENKLDVIFERFVQLDKLFTRDHDGSGIGLSIVKSLVEMHEGKISVKNRPEEGSEFIVELPSRLISDENSLSSYKVHNIQENRVERVYIEFSDINKE